MPLRTAWCAFLILQSALATSTLILKKTAFPAPNYPPCLRYLPSYLTLPSTYPPFLPNCGKSFLRSDLHRSPEILARPWLRYYPKVQRVQLAPVCLLSIRVVRASHRSSPRFQAERSSTSSMSKNVSTALCLKMPKKQQQQQQEHEHDHSQKDIELTWFICHSPLPPPQHPHLRSRSPSPSSLSGSILELPNVPSYPRLPPIVSPPSKQLNSLSCQLSGVTNPAFFIEDEPDISAVRPAGESVGVQMP